MATGKEKKLKDIAKKFQGPSDFFEGGGKGSAGVVPNQAQYLKYKDFNPSEIHEGRTSYRGAFINDGAATNKNLFALGVRSNSPGAKGFRLNGKLYKFTGRTGSAHTEISR